ncbi:MAG: NAD(P)H-quinone oxidoreductase [Acidobacteriota bacterium]|nr:NAD(P)H-quinone oxidoreductase [Acidobacteriota bacterium]
MRAIEIRNPGGPEELVITDLPTPLPGVGEVLIKVTAAGINRPDVMQREGKYPPPPGASDILGLEVAGIITELGEGVTGCRIGDRVCALVAGGGYAEFCVASASSCLPLPTGVSMIEAAAMPETFFTVWTNVFERGQLVKGERLLVHGGASGIGTTAIQMAAAFGATVFTTAGSAEKCAACERLGAIRAINYHEEDFVDVIKALTDNAGVNVVLDMVGGSYTPRNLNLLAKEGRLVQIAILGGPKTEINWIPVMLRRLTLTGSTLRSRPIAVKAAIAKALQAKVWPLVDSGKIRPVIHATFPLEESAEAHRVMEAGHHIGKLVLLVGTQ